MSARFKLIQIITILLIFTWAHSADRSEDKVTSEDWQKIFKELEEDIGSNQAAALLEQDLSGADKRNYDKSQQIFYNAKQAFLKGKNKLIAGAYDQARILFKSALDPFPTNEEFSYFYKLTFFPAVTLSAATNQYIYDKTSLIRFNIAYDKQQALDKWVSNWTFVVSNDSEEVAAIKGNGALPAFIDWDISAGKAGRLPRGDYSAGLLVAGDYFCKFYSPFYPFSLIQQITVLETKEAITFNLESVRFEVNRAEIRPASFGVLSEAAKILKQHPDNTILIVGHTDSQASDEYNLDLSRRRAWAVLKRLRDIEGLPGNKLLAAGMGERKPVSINTTPAGRAKNRRVEFLILKNEARDKTLLGYKNFLFDEIQSNVSAAQTETSVSNAGSEKMRDVYLRSRNAGEKPELLMRQLRDLLFADQLDVVIELTEGSKKGFELYYRGIAFYWIVKKKRGVKEETFKNLTAAVENLEKAQKALADDPATQALALFWCGFIYEVEFATAESKTKARAIYRKVTESPVLMATPTGAKVQIRLTAMK